MEYDKPDYPRFDRNSVVRVEEISREQCQRLMFGTPDKEDDYVADPQTIQRNALDIIDRHKAMAEAFRKIFKIARARLEDEARAEIDVAIERLILKWRKVRSVLKS
jgi:hypothetical protein